MKMPRVLVALLAVSMLGIGASTAEAAAEKNQEVKFTTVPSGAIVGGPTRTVSAESVEAGGSHQPTNPPVDLTAEGGCSIPEGSKESATVTFTSATDCTILAKAPETSEWNPAEAKEKFEVAKGTQTLKFTSTAPTAAV